VNANLLRKLPKQSCGGVREESVLEVTMNLLLINGESTE
jgi:hypothetical protein